LITEWGSVDLDTVNNSMRVIVLEQWAKWERSIIALRVTEPSSFKQFENLVLNLRRIDPPH
jgi:hypothetical protein